MRIARYRRRLPSSLPLHAAPVSHPGWLSRRGSPSLQVPALCAGFAGSEALAAVAAELLSKVAPVRR